MWNARRLGSRRAFLLLQQLVEELRPLLLFVAETKVSSKIARTWLSGLRFNYVFGVDSNGTKGGLLLFWSNKLNVSLRSYSHSHIDVNIFWESLNWRFTGCYAPSTPNERMAFWSLLIKLHKLINSDNEKWLLGGDFNDIMFDSEKKGGNNKRSTYTGDNLYCCCTHIKVKNVTTIGPKFTWSNKRKGTNNIKQKLDRFLANSNWFDQFPKTLATNCGFFGSDHRAVKISLNHSRWMQKELNGK